MLFLIRLLLKLWLLRSALQQAKMDKRQQQLSNNRLEQLNKEVTLVLQSLQWDREQLLKVGCIYLPTLKSFIFFTLFRSC